MRIPAWSLVLSILLSSCSLVSDVEPASEAIRTEYLTQHWVHSYDEEQESDRNQIYRLADFKEFAASRFRMQYVLKRNGECDWYYLAPDDGHHFRKGTWRLDRRDDTVLHVEQEDQTVSYRIVELNKRLLRMELIQRE